MFRHYLALTEAKNLSGRHLWIACTKACATRIMARGPDREDAFSDTPEGAEHTFQPDYADDLDDDHKDEHGDDQPVVLEFKIKPDVPPMAIRHQEDGITVYDPDSVKFLRVWSGVVDDKFKDEIRDRDGEIDEVALGGLQRCTAVTCNALLKHFAKAPITLGDVPETDIGVLDILTAHNLAYKPVQNGIGRTIQQFATLNSRGAFYVVTPGHAMALINGELYDAENRGLDGRKIVAAYAISAR